MSIRAKLILVSILTLAINVAIGVYAVDTHKKAKAKALAIHDRSSSVVATSLTAQVHFKKQVQEWKNVLIRGHEQGAYEQYLQQFLDEEKLTRKAIDDLLVLSAHSEARTAAKQFLNAHQVLGRQYREALRYYQTAKPDSYITVDLRVRGIDRQPTDLLDHVVASALAYKTQSLQEVDAATAREDRNVLTTVVIALTASIALLLWIIDHSVGRPLIKATAVAQRISAGNLSNDFATKGHDEAARLFIALDAMQTSLINYQADRIRNENALKEALEALEEERALLARRVEERTEELHLANAELVGSIRTKDEFLANMSHELRTPLTTIIGISEMLIDQVYGPLNEQQIKGAETIHESGQHLLSLINDVLDVAKFGAGKMQLSRDLVPVEQLCEASLRLIQQSAQQKKLDVSSKLDPQVRVVSGDPRRLKQLLINLLSNAVKFTPEGKSIGLEVEGFRDRGRVCFSVWDKGIGIPEDQIQKLFKPFVQLDSGVERHYNGTGLGLALVYSMTELHGGSVTVESEPGRGTRINVYLPWSPHNDHLLDPASATPDDARRLSAENRFKHARILLADDNLTNAKVLSAYLKHLEYEVTTVLDGVEAVASALRSPPDVILMDIRLTSLDGLEATRRIRSNAALQDVPIITLTALAMPGDRERCLEAGASEYLNKPLGVKELHQIIQSWLQKTA